MNDPFDREIDYLRISVTDRCNLRCLYCMPETGVCRIDHAHILRYEEIAAVTAAASELGIRNVRITGGEPLVRPGLTDLVAMLSAVRGIETVTLTTNGILLAEKAEELAKAGLNRVNISLDTLNSGRYREITRIGTIEKVFEGIKAALKAGLSPVKINTVVIRGFNDTEIEALSGWAMKNDLHLRFIEFMPVNDSTFPFRDGYVSSEEIVQKIFSLFPGIEKAGKMGNGPAESWVLKGHGGSVGVISAVSHSFCRGCNRLRLTADGKLKPCLFSDEEIDLAGTLRGPLMGTSAGKEELKGLILRAAARKPASHGRFEGAVHNGRFMNEIGG